MTLAMYISTLYSVIASCFRRRRATFPTKSTNNTPKMLSGELKKITDAAPPTVKKRLQVELDSFLHQHVRYVSEKNTIEKLDWDALHAPEVTPLENLKPGDPQVMNKLVVLKFNGGLGTSMGLTGAKSALVVRNGDSFLDLTIRQILHLNDAYNVDIPLLLMNSLHTEQDTLRVVSKYANQSIRIICFNQSRYPRVYCDSNLPTSEEKDGGGGQWYPPGHGDVYTSLQHSGLMDKLLKDGKEFIFMSNCDNLGATADASILQYMIDTESDFVMELTSKTKADLKGGILVDDADALKLLEWPNVEPEHVDDFQSVKKFGVFNTNNIWINMNALKDVFARGCMDLDIFSTLKRTDSSRSMVELRTSAGSAIKFFKRARGVSVPRTRYLPVKNCSDLLLVKSSIYELQDSCISVNRGRMFRTMPVVKLGDRFKNIQEFECRIQHVPDILELDHLTVAGDVYFGRNIILRGTVIIIAKDGESIHIPDGSILENRLVSGNMLSIAL